MDEEEIGNAIARSLPDDLIGPNGAMDEDAMADALNAESERPEPKFTKNVLKESPSTSKVTPLPTAEITGMLILHQSLLIDKLL